MTSSAWNSGDASPNIALSNGDLTATNTLDGTWAGVRSNVLIPAGGKWYWEVYCDFSDMRGPFNAYANGWLAGIANATASLTDHVGADGNSAGYATDGYDNFHSVMQYVINGTGFGTDVLCNPFIFLTGAYLSFAVDTVNMLIWCRICSDAAAHTWNDTAENLSPPGTITMPTRGVGGFDISGIGGAIYPAFSGKWLNNAITLNVAGPFHCIVPTDFSPLPTNTPNPHRRTVRPSPRAAIHSARQHHPHVIPQPRPLAGLPMSERVQHRRLEHKRLTAREARDKTPPRRIIPPPQQATLWVMT